MYISFSLYSSDVVDGEEFAVLNCQDVIRLISSDKLTVTSEEKVREQLFKGWRTPSYSIYCNLSNLPKDWLFICKYVKVYEAVMNWVNINLEERSTELPQLMEFVRLPLLSQDYLLQHVETNTLMRSNAQCKFAKMFKFNITFKLYNVIL